MRRVTVGFVSVLAASMAMLQAAPAGAAGRIVIRPEEYPGPLRNPLKGFRGSWQSHTYPYGTVNAVGHNHVRWNQLENDESDGIDKIMAWSNNR